MWKACFTPARRAFGAKIGAGVGGAAALAIIGAAGYNGLAAVQPETAIAAVKNLYLAAPIPFMPAIPAFYYFYKLDKLYPTVMADLQKQETEGK